MNLGQFLLKVEDAFYIDGRGLLISPGLPLDAYTGPKEFLVNVKGPSGSVQTALLSLAVPFTNPPPKRLEYWCVFPELHKSDIPVGSEIWLPTKKAEH